MLHCVFKHLPTLQQVRLMLVYARMFAVDHAHPVQMFPALPDAMVRRAQAAQILCALCENNL